MVRRKNEKFRSNILRILSQIKSEKKTITSPIIPIYHKNILTGYLRAITKSTLEDPEEIKRLALWRKKSEIWFPAQFNVTIPGTKIWVQERLLDAKDRLLFMIETPSGRPIGHIGLFRFDFQKKECEIDNVIRGESHIPGIMTPAILTLIAWTKKYLGVEKLNLEVFSDNNKAIELYKRCGFAVIKKIPLKKVVGREKISWVEDPKRKKPLRYNVYMSLH